MSTRSKILKLQRNLRWRHAHRWTKRHNAKKSSNYRNHETPASLAMAAASTHQTQKDGK